MAKTVKEFNDFSFLELIEYFKDKCNEYDSGNKYFLPLTDLNRFELLEEKYKNELAEKDNEIKNLENKWEERVCNNYELQQTQLFKEDFTEFYVCYEHGISLDNCNCPINNSNSNFRIRWLLEDNSKYELLPSKEENK